MEIAAYYVVSEALTNTAKHARGHWTVEVSVAVGEGVLRVRIRDDGCGGAGTSATARAWSELKDRVEALGGRITVHSPREWAPPLTSASR